MERELSPETRDIILRHLAGTAKSQIAKEMGVEVSTVARRYQQGMKALKGTAAAWSGIYGGAEAELCFRIS